MTMKSPTSGTVPIKVGACLANGKSVVSLLTGCRVGIVRTIRCEWRILPIAQWADERRVLKVEIVIVPRNANRQHVTTLAT